MPILKHFILLLHLHCFLRLAVKKCSMCVCVCVCVCARAHVRVRACVQSLSCVQLFGTPWIVANALNITCPFHIGL